VLWPERMSLTYRRDLSIAPLYLIGPRPVVTNGNDVDM
jgi:hypothetical protein